MVTVADGNTVVVLVLRRMSDSIQISRRTFFATKELLMTEDVLMIGISRKINPIKKMIAATNGAAPPT